MDIVSNSHIVLAVDPCHIHNVFSNSNSGLPDHQFTHDISADVFTITVDMIKESNKATKMQNILLV